jgi:hypothetical protein
MRIDGHRRSGDDCNVDPIDLGGSALRMGEDMHCAGPSMGRDRRFRQPFLPAETVTIPR